MAQKQSRRASESSPSASAEFKLEAQVNGEKEPRADAGEWIPAFLATLKTTGNVYLSCRQAGIIRRTAYKWREENPEFREAWGEAMEDAIDLLEYNGRRRALATSDRMAIFLLQAHRYGFKQQHEHSGPGGKAIPVMHDVVSIVDDEEEE
jgi:hypothetical protein